MATRPHVCIDPAVLRREIPFPAHLRRAGAVRAVMPFSAVLQLNCVSVVNVDVAAFVQAESNRLNQHF